MGRGCVQGAAGELVVPCLPPVSSGEPLRLMPVRCSVPSRVCRMDALCYLPREWSLSGLSACSPWGLARVSAVSQMALEIKREIAEQGIEAQPFLIHAFGECDHRIEDLGMSEFIPTQDILDTFLQSTLADASSCPIKPRNTQNNRNLL